MSYESSFAEKYFGLEYVGGALATIGILIAIVLATWGIASSSRRDRLFEDRCRAAGGIVWTNPGTPSHEGCVRKLPSPPELIAS